MSDNLADFLNDNAGVVTGAAGLAVHRNITATNTNLTALRGELGKLQERFEQEKKKEARESLNRDMLFQVSQQVESIASSGSSIDQYFDILRLAEEFRNLGFTTATFTSLQDKSYFASVSSSIDLMLKRLSDSIPDETKSLITDAVEWNSLYQWAETVAIADAKLPESLSRLEESRKKLNDLVSKPPVLFSEPGITTTFFTGLGLGTILVIGGAAGGMSLLVGLGFLGWIVAGAVTFPANDRLSKRMTEYHAEINVLTNRTQSLEEHIAWLRNQRASFSRRLSKLERVPIDSIEYFTSERTDHAARFAKLDGVAEYLRQVCTALGTDMGKLPKFPEREARGGHLARRS